jgi:ribokinase
MSRMAVVGHVEWIEFARVPRLPASGEIVHVSESWQECGGGGAVAAVQLAKLSGDEVDFFTALGDDELGRRARAELERMGVRVHAAARPGPQRRGFVHIDDHGERTITIIGERIVPHGGDPLPWERLDDVAGVYFTGGDAGALRAARRAATLVATPRADQALREAGVKLDALVRSGKDPGEQLDPGGLDPPPTFVVSTGGAEGGRWEGADGATGTYAAAELPGPPVDAYGAGDSFAAGLTFGLATEQELADALELAARCGAANMTGRGPYAGQLTRAGL